MKNGCVPPFAHIATQQSWSNYCHSELAKNLWMHRDPYLQVIMIEMISIERNVVLSCTSKLKFSACGRHYFLYISISILP